MAPLGERAIPGPAARYDLSAAGEEVGPLSVRPGFRHGRNRALEAVGEPFHPTHPGDSSGAVHIG